MWIMTNKGYYSAVQNMQNPNLLLVRARVAGHLEALFTDMDANNGHKIVDGIVYTPDADYLYRVTVTREDFHVAIEEAIIDIDYANFKNSVEDDDLHTTYENVWLMTYMLQIAKDKSAAAKSAYRNYAMSLTTNVREAIQKFLGRKTK